MGNTALVFAAQQGRAGAIDALARGGAALEARNNNGMTALMMAAYKGHAGAAVALLEAGADARAALGNGSTALEFATEEGPVDERSIRCEGVLFPASPTFVAAIAGVVNPGTR